MRKSFKKLCAIAMSFAMIASLVPGYATKAYTSGDYSYFDEYSIGWNGNKVAVYQDGKFQTVDQAGLPIYNVYADQDNPFVSEIDQAWDADVITLTQPVSYTTSDGKVNVVDNMLTGFDFIADPTAIDNTEVDGKLYVYGTTEGFSYGGMSRDNPEVTANPGELLVGNKYQNHSLTILSTSDMVNWTDEGVMDSLNLTNLPSDEEDNFEKCGWTNGPSWAPSGLKCDIDGDGNYKYYLFYTNGGDSGYVMGDSPTGPWEEPEGKAIFNKSLPNCSDCNVCFDPAVLMDDDEKGEGYIYFGGLTRTSGRALKIKFDKETGRVSPDGDPVKLPTYAMFEDNEINKFNGKYYYSYCTDWGSQSLTKSVSIAVYVSSDPLNIAFDAESKPKAEVYDAFTDADGTYRHFLGTVLDNPSKIFGEGYNNHHHMQEYKGHYYIFYHSTILHNTLHRINNQYRNLHVDEIEINADTDAITGKGGSADISTYEGPDQIEAFNPYFNTDNSVKVVNATTSSTSAGVNSKRDDAMVRDSKNGSPMVLDNINTGDWTRLQGVDFTSNGLSKISAEVASYTDEGAIEVFKDDPTSAANLIATIPVVNTNGEYKMLDVKPTEELTGQHDVYFVFRGNNYNVASWKFDNADTIAAENAAKATPTPGAPTVTPTPAPQTPAPTVTPSVDYTKNYTVGKNTVKVAEDGTATYVAPSKKTATSATVPATVTVEGKSYKVTSIAANAFKNCKKLKKVTIGKNVKSIGAKAFYGCKALKTVNVKSTVLKKVGKNSLKGTAAKLTVKVSKKKVKAYKKLFKKSGMGKKARVK